MKNIRVREISEVEFGAAVLGSTRTVLVGFLAGWSKPCQLLEPVMGEVAEACGEKAEVLRVDVDDNPDLGTLYGIQSVPTLIYFVNGSPRAKIIGMASAEAILTKLESLVPGTSLATER